VVSTKSGLLSERRLIEKALQVSAAPFPPPSAHPSWTPGAPPCKQHSERALQVTPRPACAAPARAPGAPRVHPLCTPPASSTVRGPSWSAGGAGISTRSTRVAPISRRAEYVPGCFLLRGLSGGASGVLLGLLLGRFLGAGVSGDGAVSGDRGGPDGRGAGAH